MALRIELVLLLLLLLLVLSPLGLLACSWDPVAEAMCKDQGGFCLRYPDGGACERMLPACCTNSTPQCLGMAYSETDDPGCATVPTPLCQ